MSSSRPAEDTPAGPEGVPVQSFVAIYDADAAAWDTGLPQPAVLAADDAGHIGARVVDVGCGTGTTAIALAERGHEVVGFDPVPAAVEEARRRAAAAGVGVDFHVSDVFDARDLGVTADTAIDAGVFHVFSDEERPRYAAVLHDLVVPGGTIVITCFSELEGGGGPRRVTQAELRETFADGWEIVSIEPSRYHTKNRPDGGLAWQLVATRL